MGKIDFTIGFNARHKYVRTLIQVMQALTIIILDLKDSLSLVRIKLISYEDL